MRIEITDDALGQYRGDAAVVGVCQKAPLWGAAAEADASLDGLLTKLIESGEIRAKAFQDVSALTQEFDAGEFVKVQGRGNVFNQRLELVLDKIRRVIPERDAEDGFREEDAIPHAPRPIDEMWGRSCCGSKDACNKGLPPGCHAKDGCQNNGR